MKRKICVVITARPSYSRIRSALTAILNHPQLELQLVVGASALLDRYGMAIKQIKQDGFPITASVFMVLEGENPSSMAKTTGIGILELSSVLHNIQPDAVVTIADRFETMATAIAAAYMNIPLVHIQGGEITGNIDEKVRHAITKLADIHFVANQAAGQRVIRMGENPDSVFITGCPSIDIAAQLGPCRPLDFSPFERYGGVGPHLDLSGGYLVVMQHPVTTEYDQSKRHAEETLYAVKDLGWPVLWFWPNVDAGSDGTSNAIRTFREKESPPNYHFFKNMSPSDFLKLLKNASCLIGNSSVGIRESGFLGVPVVDIGSRQAGRDRSVNVLHCGYDRKQIAHCVQSQIEHGPFEPALLYGDGMAGQKIAELLATIPFTIEKKLQY